MKKRAITILELVFVIVVAGIIGTVAMPRFKQNDLEKAAEQIATHIRYAQHLAMQDDKFDPNDANWFKKRWGIAFNNLNVRKGNCNLDPKNTKYFRYSVFFDDNHQAAVPSGNANSIKEIAVNPEKNGFYLTGGWSGISEADCKKVTQDLIIGKKYGIGSVGFKGGCSGARTINFDELGRPLKAVSTTGGGASRVYDRLINSDCKIEIKDRNSKTKTITVAAQTGYVTISK